MRTLPDTCRDIKTVGSFCSCIDGKEAVDLAARSFCNRAAARSDPYVTGEDLAELKKALKDLDDE